MNSESTSTHPARNKPDATTAQTVGLAASSTPSTAELARLKIRLHQSLRQFPDFPTKGILFEDILPLFADAKLHRDLIRALELHIEEHYASSGTPDVLVGLESRGFLFGPSLALKLGVGFVPVRKQGKLPGPIETASYQKEYGEDFFQIQSDGLRPGQKVLIVDDIIATGMKTALEIPSTIQVIDPSHIGGSAAAAASLVKKLGGVLIGYVFILELNFLKGRTKLDAPVATLLSSQEEGISTT